MDLYNTSEVENWAVHLGPAARDGLAQMMTAVDSIDIDDLLDPITTDWCDQQLRDLQFDGQLDGELDHKRPHLAVYLRLRDKIQAVIGMVWSGLVWTPRPDQTSCLHNNRSGRPVRPTRPPRIRLSGFHVTGHVYAQINTVLSLKGKTFSAP
jgi:hypothetical protein